MRRLLLSALPVLLLATAAEAQQATPRSATPPAAAQTALIYPLTVVVKNNMDFGYLGVTAVGTAVIDANSGVLSRAAGSPLLVASPVRQPSSAPPAAHRW